jgi:fructoselysine-6-P-deglycase FrlB-like protein
MTWSPDPEGFQADLERIPASLRSLADALPGEPWPVDAGALDRVVFVGMGSSRFAALAAAARLRAHGFDAVAEYASAEAVHPGGPGTLAVGISAGGGTPETAEALARHTAAGSFTVALTNAEGSALGVAAGRTIALHAGEETGGVACRTYHHTLVRLLQLLAQLTGVRSGDVSTLARRAADAADDLLARRDDWLAPSTEAVTGAGAPFLLAPHERLANAEQGALMFREGPRLHATACETGDWLHVDVYLTKPLDYRALLFAGSRFDEDVMTWMRERGATVVVVGADIADAAICLRYPGVDDPDVALLIENLVPELVAARRWPRG